MEHQSLALLGGPPIASHLTYPSWPPVDEQTAQALVDVYRSGCWSFQGPQERSFASKFAAYHDAAYGVFVMNGTVALQCALHACGIQADDEVIVPAVTWIATAGPDQGQDFVKAVGGVQYAEGIFVPNGWWPQANNFQNAQMVQTYW